jgi:hypothetical protein
MSDTLVERITQYLGAGGLFNPEAMEHDKVRDLLLDCRDRITALEREREATLAYDAARAKVKG